MVLEQFCFVGVFSWEWVDNSIHHMTTSPSPTFPKLPGAITGSPEIDCCSSGYPDAPSIRLSMDNLTNAEVFQWELMPILLLGVKPIDGIQLLSM